MFTVDRTRLASQKELEDLLIPRLRRMLAAGETSGRTKLHSYISCVCAVAASAAENQSVN